MTEREKGQSRTALAGAGGEVTVTGSGREVWRKKKNTEEERKGRRDSELHRGIEK